jgi:hypothetical protein
MCCARLAFLMQAVAMSWARHAVLCMLFHAVLCMLGFSCAGSGHELGQACCAVHAVPCCAVHVSFCHVQAVAMSWAKQEMISALLAGTAYNPAPTPSSGGPSSSQLSQEAMEQLVSQLEDMGFSSQQVSTSQVLSLSTDWCSQVLFSVLIGAHKYCS